jgi:enterochelin esterase-like enzyme
MRIEILLLSATLLPVATPAQQAPPLTPDGVIYSETLGNDVPYTVCLPEGYYSSDREYPVLYFLHGYGSTGRDLINRGGINAIADEMAGRDRISPMILVFPDAKSSWYINGLQDRYEDFFINEFIPRIESAYRCKKAPGARSIAGISMGGYGALLYALKYPELFGVCCALSPAVLTDIEIKYMPDDAYGMFREAFGERESDLWQRYNILEIIRKTDAAPDSLPLFYIDCGDGDFLYRGNAALHVAMRDRNISHSMAMRHGGHTWDYWIPALAEVLKFVSVNMESHEKRSYGREKNK